MKKINALGSVPRCGIRRWGWPLLLLPGLWASPALAQESPLVTDLDSLITIELGEVIVISSPIRELELRAQPYPLATLDQYLEDSNNVYIVKRGAYAWEPMLSDMGSGRMSITI